MPQLATDELDHDRVVEEAESRNLVRDEVVRIGDVGHRVLHAGLILTLQAPLLSSKHEGEHLQLLDALAHEVRGRRLLRSSSTSLRAAATTSPLSLSAALASLRAMRSAKYWRSRSDN